MKVEKIKEKVKDIPHMTSSQAREITKIILENKFQNILELGFDHGVSTCYIAGALDELGKGSITTIDFEKARNATPNIDYLLNCLGLSEFVTVYYEPSGYIWRLMKMIEEDSSPRFDLCYIDGAHDWFTDGFAFFLADRLLKVGGIIIFDDLNWTYDRALSFKNTEKVKKMPIEEKQTPQVKKVYDLLVKNHPAYDQFIVKDNWAYARKDNTGTNANLNRVRKELIYQDVGLGSAFHKTAKKLAGKLISLKKKVDKKRLLSKVQAAKSLSFNNVFKKHTKE